MDDIAYISQREFLGIRQPNGVVACGSSQEWYPRYRQRMSGCGPTVASMQIYYLARTRNLKALCPGTEATKESFTKLMETMFRYVTPGMRGVHRTSIYTEGALLYAKKRDVCLEPHVLPVSAHLHERPSEQQLHEFLLNSINKDIPVAFLNLSSGALHNLDTWHWVLLVGVSRGSPTAMMYDQGKKDLVDLSLWLYTNTLGGGFVSLSVLDA